MDACRTGLCSRQETRSDGLRVRAEFPMPPTCTSPDDTTACGSPRMIRVGRCHSPAGRRLRQVRLIMARSPETDKHAPPASAGNKSTQSRTEVQSLERLSSEQENCNQSLLTSASRRQALTKSICILNYLTNDHPTICSRRRHYAIREFWKKSSCLHHR